MAYVSIVSSITMKAKSHDNKNSINTLDNVKGVTLMIQANQKWLDYVHEQSNVDR